MFNIRKNLINNFLIILLIIFIDQWSKIEVISFFNNYFESNSVKINSYFNIVLLWNKGISFGMLNDIQHSNKIFIYLSLLIIVTLLIWLIRSSKYNSIALSLVLGGAIGNLIDRIRYGAVADFLEVHFNNYYWPAFNIADSCISIGVSILLITTIIEEKKKKL